VLLAQHAVLCILVRLLGDGFVNQHHLALVGVARVCIPLLTGLFSFLRESLLNLLEVIEQVTDALGYRVCLEFALGLPRPGAHKKNMAHEISIVDGPDLFGSLGRSIALVRTGQ